MARRIRDLLVAMHGVRIPGACAIGEAVQFIRRADALASAVYDVFSHGEDPALPALQRYVQRLRDPVQAFTWARASLDTGPPPGPEERRREKG